MRCRLALKRELPQTCCTECGAAGYNTTVANGRCNKIIGEERCHGINQRATNIADWEECASCRATGSALDRKSTRLNSSHQIISYAVFCLKKKKKQYHQLNIIV